MAEIKISVVMSVFNADKYLRDAVESILGQTFTDYEFIIINDGSTDRSLEILESYKDDRIVLINQSNSGLPKALNIGIDRSKSDYIARMDADDISLPQRLEKQYSFMIANPDCILVGSNAIVIDMNGEYVFTTSNKITDHEIKKNLPKLSFLHSSVMFKKKSFYSAGKYCESMLKGQDTVLFNRMVHFGKFYNIKEPFIKYRVVPTANSVKEKLKKRFSDIQKTAIKNNILSQEDENYLKKILFNRSKTKNYGNYFFYMAKKYLWNNYKPKLARMNLILAFKNNLRFRAVILYIFTFLPENIITVLYLRFKSFSGS